MDFDEASQLNSCEPTSSYGMAGPLPHEEAIVPLLCLKQRHLNFSFAETHGLSSRGLARCFEQLQSNTNLHCRLHQLSSSKRRLKVVWNTRGVQAGGACQMLEVAVQESRNEVVKWICELCNQEITKKHSSVRCNSSIEHWIHLKCGDIKVKDYKKQTSWTCKLHRKETENQKRVTEETRGEIEKSRLQPVTGRRKTIMKHQKKQQTDTVKIIGGSTTKRESRIIETTPPKSQNGDGLLDDNGAISVSPQKDSSTEYERPKVLSNKAAFQASESSTGMGTSTISIIGLPPSSPVAATPTLNTSTCMDKPRQQYQTEKKPYPCPYEPECLHSFFRAAELKRHIPVHTDEQPFQCPVCKFRTNRKFTLKQHCLHQHKINPEDPIFLESTSDAIRLSQSTKGIGTPTDAIIGPSPGASVAKIPILNPSTCMIEALDRDQTKKKSYHQCPNEPEASLVLATPAELKRHIRFHTGEQTFCCPICPFHTNRKFKFWQHCLDIHDINPQDPILIQ